MQAMDPREKAEKRLRIRTAIIDIGSNSVRLVVYQGARRAPATIFNEKLLVGLGHDLGRTGRISEERLERAGRALRRFRRLADEMDVSSLRCVATAAVREADNGADLIHIASEAGLSVEVLSGQEEARYAAFGVLSAFPLADGIVGDLGGGSLELAEISNGEIKRCISRPLGVLRISGEKSASLAKKIGAALDRAGWTGLAAEHFYCVGGSWRTLGRVEMAAANYPLPVVHGFWMEADRALALESTVAKMDEAALKKIPDLSSARIGTLPAAAALLAACCKMLKTKRIHFSGYGLREGLLYGALDDTTRRADPLLVATEDTGGAHSRFKQHGRAMYEWIRPVFEGDRGELRRLCKAACNLSDVAWRANPDFREVRGLEFALHGNWVGVGPAGRELMGQAIWSCFGGGTDAYPGFGGLAEEPDRQRAAAWGLALRLAQRLSGGTLGVLRKSRLSRDGDTIILDLLPGAEMLAGEAVEKRLRQFAQWLDCDYQLRIDPVEG